MLPAKDVAAAGGAVLVVGGSGYDVYHHMSQPYILEYFLKDGRTTEYEGGLGRVDGNVSILVADTSENARWWKQRYKELKDKNQEKRFKLLMTDQIRIMTNINTKEM